MEKGDSFTKGKGSFFLSFGLHILFLVAMLLSPRLTRSRDQAENTPSIPIELAMIGEETLLQNLTSKLEKKMPSSISDPKAEGRYDDKPEEDEKIAPEKKAVQEKEPVAKEDILNLKKQEKKNPAEEKAVPSAEKEVKRKSLQGLLSKIPEIEKDAAADAKKAEVDVKTNRPTQVYRMSISEIDAFRMQIEKCWDVPIGAKNIEQHLITLRIRLNKDGTIARKPEPVGNYPSGPLFSVLIRSAVRAVEQCQPFRLPEKKYNTWKEIDVVFNPKDML